MHQVTPPPTLLLICVDWIIRTTISTNIFCQIFQNFLHLFVCELWLEQIFSPFLSKWLQAPHKPKTFARLCQRIQCQIVQNWVLRSLWGDSFSLNCWVQHISHLTCLITKRELALWLECVLFEIYAKPYCCELPGKLIQKCPTTSLLHTFLQYLSVHWPFVIHVLCL